MAYDNFRDKVDDSRYYKTFQYEYISNAPAAQFIYHWNAHAATWWNANKPASEPTVIAGLHNELLSGKRALIYIENQRDEALDSLPYEQTISVYGTLVRFMQ